MRFLKDIAHYIISNRQVRQPNPLLYKEYKNKNFVEIFEQAAARNLRLILPSIGGV
jgi:hypothetical protein